MIQAIAHELRFWKDFVQTERFKGWIANKRTPELQEPAYKFLKKETGKVLDLGSGVISLLHGTSNVTASDPLSPLYEIIFDYKKHGIKPPLPYAGEDITFEKEFDIVHISNALDHSQNPKKVFENMIKASKKYVIVQGFENEAVYENYQGFHQFNMSFDESLKMHDKNGLIFDSKDYDIKLVESYVTLTHLNKNWIIAIFKHANT